MVHSQNFRGLPWWLSGKESTCQSRRYKRVGFHPWVRKIPWRRKWQLLLYPWLENSMGLQKSQAHLSNYTATTTEFQNQRVLFFFLIFSFLKTIIALLKNSSLKLEISNNVELTKVFILSLLCKSCQDLCHLRTYK